MARGIPVSSRRGVQAVALLCAAALAVGAVLYITTGYGTLFPGCRPQMPPPYALFLAAAQAGLAAGFVVAALKDLSGPRLKDPLLLTLFLTLASFLALNAGAYTLVTGIARFGRMGCITVGAPWSYGVGTVGVIVGAVALLAAATVALGSDDDD